jgi:hypothetical protein
VITLDLVAGRDALVSLAFADPPIKHSRAFDPSIEMS